MKTPLQVYLHDHLAGAAFAIDLVEALRDRHRGETLGVFAGDLLVEIESDRVQLRQLDRRLATGGNRCKELVARLVEKLSRAKLRRRVRGGLGTLESLETLALGILGKEALWTALALAAGGESRLRGIDYQALVRRARQQHAGVETRRLEVARWVFAGAGGPDCPWTR